MDSIKRFCTKTDDCDICRLQLPHIDNPPSKEMTQFTRVNEYVRFSEYNFDEKLTWHFYIPVRDNRETLNFLHNFGFEKFYYSTRQSPFVFDIKVRFSESEVDAIITGCQSEPRNLKSHNKMQGRCTLPEKFKEYARDEAKNIFVWDATTRPEMWEGLFESSETEATTLTRLTFPDSNSENKYVNIRFFRNRALYTTKWK